MMDMESYRHKLECLKKNKETIPLQLLTSKYQRDYERAKWELKVMTEELLEEAVLKDVKVRRDRADEWFQKVNRTIEESGVLMEISHAVYQEQDLDKVMKLANELREMVNATDLQRPTSTMSRS